jgi:hypothetical protein
MWTPQIKQYIAETAITPNLIVKFGSTDDYAVLAAAGTDKVMGVSGNVGGDAGGRVDIIKAGIADVIAGGTFARGDLLMSDAAGKAIVAAASAASNVRVIGTAEASAVSGDIVGVLISPCSFQG